MLLLNNRFASIEFTLNVENIEFTLSIDNKKQMPFFDILDKKMCTTKLETDVLKKNTHNHECISNNSHYEGFHKIEILNKLESGNYLKDIK